MNPSGAYNLNFKDESFGRMGSIGNVSTKEEALSMFNFKEDEIDMESSYITFRDRETGEVEIIYGYGRPELYDEVIADLEK